MLEKEILGSVDECLNQILDKLTCLEERFDQSFKGLSDRLSKIELLVDKLEVKLERLEIRSDRLESKMDKSEVRLDRLDTYNQSVEDKVVKGFKQADEYFSQIGIDFKEVQTGIAFMNEIIGEKVNNLGLIIKKHED